MLDPGGTSSGPPPPSSQPQLHTSLRGGSTSSTSPLTMLCGVTSIRSFPPGQASISTA
ncbi:MAG TPA: hypothetical protein VMV08_04470 [Gaiellaceae bacterium]|nr:hypothetical protein [Gaiellaceae bacterium]